jgi:hypothetical protein
LQAGFAQASTALVGKAPSSASAGTPFTVTGLKATASLPAALVQAGVNLDVFHDGQTINGTVTETIVASGATPASVDLSAPGSGTVHAPGGVAEPLTITVDLPNTQWTPTGPGTVTLALAKTGDQHNDAVTTANGASGITDGSVLLGAAIFHPTPDIFLVCKPGTVDGAGKFTAASSTAPFLSLVASGGGSSTTTTTAAPKGPSVATNLGQVAPGGSLTFAGDGFPPNTDVSVTLFSTPVNLGTTKTDANGHFSVVVAIPSNIDPGQHTLTASTADGKTASVTFTVIAPTPTSAGATTTTAAAAVLGTTTTKTPLAFTGLDTRAWLTIAAGCLLSGFIMLFGKPREAAARATRR